MSFVIIASAAEAFHVTKREGRVAKSHALDVSLEPTQDPRLFEMELLLQLLHEGLRALAQTTEWKFLKCRHSSIEIKTSLAHPGQLILNLPGTCRRQQHRIGANIAGTVTLFAQWDCVFYDNDSRYQ
jgi:hypothetical protein